MKEDPNKLIGKKYMPVIKEHDFFWWKYDDRSSAAIVIDVETDKVLKAKCFDSKIERKEFKEKIKTSAQRKHIEFRNKGKQKVNCGLKQLGKISSQFSGKTAAATCYVELKKMLFSCGSDQKSFCTVLTLFSSLLAGYYARFAWSYIDEPAEKIDPHAPILAITKRDDSYEALKEIAHSVIVDSSPKSKKPDGLYFKTPPVLPVSISDKRIEDSAACYLLRSKRKHYNNSFPAQYRDTSVLINTTFYTPKELFAFQRRNPWVSTVLFAPQDRKLLMTPIRLDGKVFSRCNREWNPEDVRALMLCFAARVSCKLKKKKRKEFLDQYTRIKRLIDNNNSKRGTVKYRGTKQHWLALQLIALEDVTDFLKAIEAVNEYESECLKAEWFNCLLPNSVSAPSDHSPMAERAAINPQRNYRELVEQALKEILTHEHLSHFAFVPPRAVFPSTVSGHEIWGYLRNYRSNKDSSSFHALIFSQKQFCDIVKLRSSIHCDWITVVRAFRKKAPSYVHPTSTMRLDSQKSENVLILKLDELKFLPQEILSAMNSLYQ